MNIKLYENGKETYIPEYTPIFEVEEINKPKTDETTATNNKTTFIKACISMANTWFGCLFFFVPFFGSGSEYGFWRAETVLFLIIALHWTIFNTTYTFNKLKNDLNK